MITIEIHKRKAVPECSIEIAERKGVGHPDTICDSIAESISIALSREYKKTCGDILHHNIDKALLAAGKASKIFGGGRVIKPMEITIGDRATFIAGGKKIPVKEIAVEAAKEWFGKNLRFVEPDKHVKYRIVLAPGSEELTGIFKRGGTVRPANDTSAAVGFYPLSPTEKVVLELEKYLNSKGFKKRRPETGEDVKIMGFRKGDILDITVAIPLISKFIDSEKTYFDKKERLYEEIKEFLKRYRYFKGVNISLNALDRRGKGLDGIYLSLLGTSAEDADSGQVGRGNKVNGLISVCRPLGTEAAAGKNPVSHVGKIYNILAHKLAKKVYEEVSGIKEVYIYLLSRIGSPIDTPLTAFARVTAQENAKANEISREIREIIEKELSNISQFCDALSKGKYPVC